MNHKHKQALKLLLYFDTLRGEDSTGVAAIRNNHKIEVFKSVVPGYDYVKDPRFENLLRLTDKIWIGHNRLGTVGKNTKQNAHPFEVKDNEDTVLVGVHNGTIKNRHSLDNHNDYGTDSEALLNMIYNDGPRDAMAKTEGAWALVWFDYMSDSLHFLRNKERTLYFVYEKGKKTILWASEIWMLKTVCSKVGIDIDEDQVFSFAEDRHYIWDMPKTVKDTVSFYTEEGLAGKPETFFQAHRKNWWSEEGSGYKKPEEKQRVEVPAKAPQGNVVPLLPKPEASSVNVPSTRLTSSSGVTKPKIGFQPTVPHVKKVKPTLSTTSYQSKDISPGAYMVKGFKGTLIAKPEAQLILDSGCAWCEEELITLEDAFGWMSPNHVICHKCLADKHPQPPYMDGRYVVN